MKKYRKFQAYSHFLASMSSRYAINMIKRNIFLSFFSENLWKECECA